jgi:hypothetical protein
MSTERIDLNAQTDFTMMYAAHDAFSFHLDRLVDAADAGQGWSEATAIRWGRLIRQLHIHHRAEDDALWPPLQARIVDAAELAVLAAMEAEHGYLEPAIAAVDSAFADRDGDALTGALLRMRIGLTGHMRHEENSALPLVDAYLGPKGWDEFGRYIRRTLGLRAGAEYFPWLLEGASDEMAAKVLGLVPPPVRFLYRRVWLPRYRRVSG